jgi:hypothetical protein
MSTRVKAEDDAVIRRGWCFVSVFLCPETKQTVGLYSTEDGGLAGWRVGWGVLWRHPASDSIGPGCGKRWLRRTTGPSTHPAIH